jgi:hypothetical protein
MRRWTAKLTPSTPPTTASGIRSHRVVHACRFGVDKDGVEDTELVECCLDALAVTDLEKHVHLDIWRSNRVPLSPNEGSRCKRRLDLQSLTVEGMRPRCSPRGIETRMKRGEK